MKGAGLSEISVFDLTRCLGIWVSTRKGKISKVLPEAKNKYAWVRTYPKDMAAEARSLPRDDDIAGGQPRLKLPLRQEPNSRRPGGRALGEVGDVCASGN